MAPKLPSNFLVKLIVVISPQTDYILKLKLTGTNAFTALPSLVKVRIPGQAEQRSGVKPNTFG